MRTRYRWCTICGGTLHEVDNWPSNCMPEYNYARSDYPSPAIITDSLPGGVNGLYHHAEKRKTDSKSEYRRWTRSNGCIEVGTERPQNKKREEVTFGRDVIEAGINEALQECSFDDGKGDDSVTVVADVNKGRGIWHGA